MLLLLNVRSVPFTTYVKYISRIIQKFYCVLIQSESKSITAELHVVINKCLRKILRILWPDQITNKEL